MNPAKNIGPLLRQKPVNQLEALRVYLITQRSYFAESEFLPSLELALRGGVRALQLREKDLGSRELFALARKVQSLTSKYDAKLFINDRADIAHMAGAAGVHLAESSVPVEDVRKHFSNLLIGVSTHSIESAHQAESGGADFITFSPIFETPSKKEFGPPQGLGRLREVCREIRIPVLALGGIRKDRVTPVLDQGAFGVALISGIWNGPDIKQDTLEYTKFFGRREPT